VAHHARVLCAGVTDVGKKRNHNEDTFLIVEDESLYMVADGMGGHASGEVASKLAVQTMKEFFVATSADPEATWPYKMDKNVGYEENRLITGIKLANRRIYEASRQESRLRGMGTTLVSLFISRDGCLIGHVGDSRVYKLRDGKLDQLTEDHSLLNDYKKMKEMSEEEIAGFPHKNVIVRALGMKESVKVDTILDPPKMGDTYILCSDGLSGPVGDEQIESILSSTKDLKSACKQLIETANQHGGPDNITVVICQWIGSG
jgi:serine/threonine protein phosphatase PrpC